jgi:hypothetical protein
VNGSVIAVIIIIFNIHLWLKKYNGFTRSAKVKIEKKKFTIIYINVAKNVYTSYSTKLI